jgi:hypothetical protein
LLKIFEDISLEQARSIHGQSIRSLFSYELRFAMQADDDITLGRLLHYAMKNKIILALGVAEIRYIIRNRKYLIMRQLVAALTNRYIEDESHVSSKNQSRKRALSRVIRNVRRDIFDQAD